LLAEVAQALQPLQQQHDRWRQCSLCFTGNTAQFSPQLVLFVLFVCRPYQQK
jgi:hypothetical protein